MGQEQHKSKYKSYNYSSKSDDEEEENYAKNDKGKSDDKDSDEEEGNSIILHQIKETLNQMNLSDKEIIENIKFISDNIKKLLIINKIITNIKNADLYDVSPGDILAKIVPESELIDETPNPKYGPLEIKTLKLLKCLVAPEYILPELWQELFKLKCSDTAIKKLLIQSEIESLIVNYSNWKNKSKEYYRNLINQNNYEEYLKDYEEYYKTERLEKINKIIDFAKNTDVYNLTPFLVIKKYYPDHPKYLYYPKKWEDLKDWNCDDDKIEYLLGVMKWVDGEKKRERYRIFEKQENERRIRENKEKEEKERQEKEMEKEKVRKKLRKNIVEKMKRLKNLKIPSKKVIENKDYYCDNLSFFEDIDRIVKYATWGGFNNRLSPRAVYKKAYSYERFKEDNWKDLNNLGYTEDDYNNLFTAVFIEYVKCELAKYDKTRSYDYYDDLININNYKEYDKKRNKLVDIDNIIFNADDHSKYIEKNSSYLSSEEYSEAKKRIQEYKDYKQNYLNVWDEEKLKNYKEPLLNFRNLIHERITEKEKAEEEAREEEERARRRENYNYSNSSKNYSSSSSNSSSTASKNNDMKKAYVCLCQNCKNSCVGCQRKIKNTEIGVSKAFGLHIKCKGGSCYICGKSNSTVKERNSSYLCKSCYHSNKYDPTKCLSCKKSYK